MEYRSGILKMSLIKRPTFHNLCKGLNPASETLVLRSPNKASLAPISSVDEAPVYKTWKDVPIQKKTTVFSFRIPKKEIQQIKYISSHTGLSINTLCLMAIQANNRKLLKELEEIETDI